jgi:hypothetical protein
MSDPMTVEKEASAMGWVPEESYKGDKANWVDADTFVEKGRHVLPILRKNNERLLGELGNVKNDVLRLNKLLADSAESMEAMKEFHEEATKAQVEKARRDIIASLKEAKQEGDVDAEVEITSQLSQFDAVQKEASKPVEATKTEKAQALETILSPAFTEWTKEQAWFGQDPERTGLAIGVAQRLRREGVTSEGKEFLNAVTQAVDKVFGGGQRQTVDKVEGSRGGGGKSSGGTGYGDLPADARAVCDKQASKFVGEGRAFKTTKDWQQYYAKTYLQGA